MRGRWLTAVAALLLLGAAPAEEVEANLEVVGRWDLGGASTYADVTVVGTTAVVATGNCAGASATVLDIKDARKPKALATIPLPIGAVAIDLDSTSVDSETFTGDLLAVALGPCAGGPPSSVGFYDISDASSPRMMSQRDGGTSVSLAHRPDGRVLAVRATAAGVAVDELSDPTNPFEHAVWVAAPAAGGCGSPSVQLFDEGELAAAVVGGGVYALDLIEPARPAPAGPAAGGGSHVGVLPLGNRTIAVVADDGLCPPGEPGLRILTIEPGEPPVEGEPLRYAGAGRPGRLVASGGYAYVAWGEAGLRVVDFAEVRPRTVAQFIPAGADIVAVGLLPEHVVVTDAAQGVFVLERPDEGGGRATFWSQFLSLLPYLGGAVFLTALVLVPRLVGAHARAGSHVPVPGAEPVRRRRA